MSNKPNRLSPEELLAFIKNMPPELLRGLVSRANLGGDIGLEARCEEFFSTFDLWLPTHESSRREAHRVLRRLTLPPEIQ